MNVLGISGSPRVGGNTDILLEKVLEGARDAGANTEKIIEISDNSLSITLNAKTASPIIIVKMFSNFIFYFLQK